MGKNSEVAWIQRVAKQLANEASKDQSLDGLPPTATSGIPATSGSKKFSVCGIWGHRLKGSSRIGSSRREG